MDLKNTLIFDLTTFELARGTYPTDFIDNISCVHKLDINTVARLKLALIEAIANSVEHGNLGLKSEWKDEIDENGLDRFSLEKANRLNLTQYKSKKVKILVQYSDKSLELSVEDEGDGFDPMLYPTCNLTDSYGRGLYLIKATMDRVEFENNGRRIKMIKNF